MSFWEELEARQLPSETVRLSVDDGTVSIELRALPAAEFDALLALYPGEEPGQVDVAAIWPSLLAASVMAPEGSKPRDPQWWADLVKRGGVTSGELGFLLSTAWRLNDRTPTADAGKG